MEKRGEAGWSGVGGVGGWVRLILDVQDLRGGTISDVHGHERGVEGLENWAVLMDVKCVSFLRRNVNLTFSEVNMC